MGNRGGAHQRAVTATTLVPPPSLHSCWGWGRGTLPERHSAPPCQQEPLLQLRAPARGWKTEPQGAALYPRSLLQDAPQGWDARCTPASKVLLGSGRTIPPLSLLILRASPQILPFPPRKEISSAITPPRPGSPAHGQYSGAPDLPSVGTWHVRAPVSK